MTDDLILRPVIDADLPIFFAQQLDAEANTMAAFTAANPADRAAFDAHWQRVRGDGSTVIRTIVVDGQVVGNVLSYVEWGRPEVSYWIGKEYWGRGYATRALALFLAEVQPCRPIAARVVKDNIASLRVLQKCGFVVVGEDKGFAHGRNAEVAEWLLELRRREPLEREGR